MSDMVLGRATCPHCQAPIVVMGDEYGRQTPVEPDQYLVVFDGKPPTPHRSNRLSAFDIRTGVLVHGRRATAKERQAYQRSGSIGYPFTIGAIWHLSRCPKWDGQPFRMPSVAFRGQQAWGDRNKDKPCLLQEMVEKERSEAQSTQTEIDF